ncbi:hypothetical protein ACFWNN_07515 [Lentzea sp. NPDC058450]|uniref:hypothetical protein n=1 Tax=Lentzea sp. NPDC058450 TaxID=3346505 RepID=UPI00365C5926
MTLTTLAYDDTTTAADALLEALHQDLSGLPASVRLDAVLCLLEAARQVLGTPGPATAEDLDRVRATMRAASLSVRGYLWQAREPE